MAQVGRGETLAHIQEGPALAQPLEPVVAAAGAVPGQVRLETVGTEELGAWRQQAEVTEGLARATPPEVMEVPAARLVAVAEGRGRQDLLNATEGPVRRAECF